MVHRRPAADACNEFRKFAQTRRDLLKVGVLGTLGIGLNDLLRLQTQARNTKHSPVKAVIMLQKYGAPSHVDMWDMKPKAPVEICGEFRPIATGVPGYVVCEHMPRMAKLVKNMTIVRSMGHTVANHNPATYFMLSGRTSTADIVQVGAKPDDWSNYGAALSIMRPGNGRLPDAAILPHLCYDQVYTTPGQFGGILGKSTIRLSLRRTRIIPISRSKRFSYTKGSLSGGSITVADC